MPVIGIIENKGVTKLLWRLLPKRTLLFTFIFREHRYGVKVHTARQLFGFYSLHVARGKKLWWERRISIVTRGDYSIFAASKYACYETRYISRARSEDASAKFRPFLSGISPVKSKMLLLYASTIVKSLKVAPWRIRSEKNEPSRSNLNIVIFSRRVSYITVSRDIKCARTRDSS